MSETLGSLKTFCGALLDDTTRNFWSDTQKNQMANAANRHVYGLVMQLAPDRLLTRTAITWPAGVSSLDVTGSGYLNATPKQVVYVVETQFSGLPSSSNPTIRDWTPSYPGDTADWYGIEPTGRGTVADGDTCWHFERSNMVVAPTPAGPRYLTIGHVPVVADMTTDADALLGGLAGDHHDAVVYRAAVLMNAKQNGQNKMVWDLWHEAEARLKAEAAVQSMRSRTVRNVDRDKGRRL